MRAVIQRCRHASVSVDGAVVSRIGQGLCCLIGVEHGDGEADIDYIAAKICGLRIFNDPAGQMNLGLADVGGDILVVSQFTLLGDARKGRRPSYSAAEPPETARGVFEQLVQTIRSRHAGTVGTGVFQADMDLEILNQGPVTILLDSRKRF